MCYTFPTLSCLFLLTIITAYYVQFIFFLYTIRNKSHSWLKGQVSHREHSAEEVKVEGVRDVKIRGPAGAEHQGDPSYCTGAGLGRLKTW